VDKKMISSPHPKIALKSRITQVRQFLKPNQAILISLPTDVVYFSGFQMLVPEEREGFFVVTPAHSYLIKASFSPSPAEEVSTILENCRPLALARHLKTIMDKEQLRTCFYDETNLFVEELRTLKEHLPENTQLKNFPRDWMWSLRCLKDKYEIASMQKAGQIIAQVFQELPNFFAAGKTELEVRHWIEQRITYLGAESVAFPTIVAFGVGGTSPHYQPGTVALQEETSILIDAGAMVHGYRSDMTRTWWFGEKPDPLFTKIEQLVKKAHDQTLELVAHRSEKITAKSLDTSARSLIEQAGYGHHFIHTTGHGIGLDIHEPPSLSWANDQAILPGMVITIEPGIYLSQKFGYRYENTILVTDQGAQVLTQVE
jgi:Xaa-Pro aminopeptidase